MILDKIKNYPVATVFMIVLGTILVLNFLNPYPFVFYHDSQHYWDLSDTFVKSDNFSFLNYDHKIRGYLFPFLIFLIRKLSQVVGVSDDFGYVFFMSIIYSMFVAIWFPKLVEILYKKKVSPFERVVFSALFLFFWHSYMFYPMSDLLPILFLVSGALLINGQRWYGLIIAGAFLGGIPLIRPAYLIALPFFAAWLIIFYYKEIGLTKAKISLFFFLFLIGGVIVCAPQFWINLYHYSVKYPFVRSEISGKSLLTSQLRWGITLQKYETNIGVSYPNAGVFFIDNYGAAILEKEGYQEKLKTNSDFTFPTAPENMIDYLSLVKKYPLDFLFIYFRHLFNGLDVVYNSVYVKDVYNTGLLIRLINYSVWFFALIYVIRVFPSVRMKIWRDQRLLYLASFLVPSLFAIPTAVEVRFMIPFQIVAYTLVVFGFIPESMMKNYVWKKKFISKYFLWYIIFIGLCFSFSLSTYLGLQFGPYILSR